MNLTNLTASDFARIVKLLKKKEALSPRIAKGTSGNSPTVVGRLYESAISRRIAPLRRSGLHQNTNYRRFPKVDRKPAAFEIGRFLRGGNILFVAVVVWANGVCRGSEDEGFRWWSYVEAAAELAKDWEATFKQEFRLRDDGHFYYEHSALTFTYSGLAPWLDAGAGFQLIYEKDHSDEWRRENRPYLDATLKGNLFDCSVSSRNRIEYRNFEAEEDVWRYRNKFTVKLPFELTTLKLKPYIADEIFITLNDGNFDKNRVYLGVIMPITQGVELDIYYVWQASRSSGEWKNIEVLGTGLKLEF